MMASKRDRIRLRDEEIRNENILLADLAKPDMKNGLDVSLFTFREKEAMKKAQTEHDIIFRKRAEELRFYPEIISKKEKAATLRCMTYDELRPFYKIVAIHGKNYRLIPLMTLDKVEIRKYCRMTHHFSETSSYDQENYSDKTIVHNTKKYFELMTKNSEKVFEEPYYFLDEKRKKRVLRALSNYFPKGGFSELKADLLVNEDNRIIVDERGY